MENRRSTYKEISIANNCDNIELFMKIVSQDADFIFNFQNIIEYNNNK